jgi:hypothetical protein
MEKTAGVQDKLTGNEIEAANRAEATALLIRAGDQVYRPEADVAGEDLVVRTPAGELLSVQLKSRLTVDEIRYGGTRKIWMLFPDRPFSKERGRTWYLMPHNVLFAKIKKHHGHTSKWNDKWSSGSASKAYRAFLSEFAIF